MSSDPNQEPVESSQLLVASEPTVYAAGTASSPASQPDESVPGQQLAFSEPPLSQGRMAPSPPSSRKTSRSWLWLSLFILVLVIAGAVTTTMLLLLVTNPTQAVNTVVQDYYTAVERQQYATAYTYVNPSSAQLQLLSLAAYTKSSLSLDQTSGTLTAYTISTTSITNGIATVIVDRTRGGMRGEIFVELEQIGGNWKINAIVPGWPIPS